MNKRVPHGRYGHFVPYLLLACDLLVINAIFIIILLLNREDVPRGEGRMLMILYNVAYILIDRRSFGVRGARTVTMDKLVAKALSMVVLQGVLFFALVMFLGDTQVGWSFYAELFGTLFVVLPISWIVTRLIVKKMRRRGRNTVNVVFFGANDAAARLARELQDDAGYGYVIHGFFDLGRPENYSAGKYLGNLKQFKEYIDKHQVDEIYYTLPGDDDETLKQIIKIADDNIITFYYVPQLTRTVARTFHLDHVGLSPVLRAHRNPLENPVNRFIKRGFDILFSVCFLLVSPIIFIPVAIAIKMSSSGPVFFRQKRTGYLGKEFTCLKFRTMRVNDQSNTCQAVRGDSRTTKMGAFLRRTSIDELPQFINVLKGDMSIVGPRPHMLKHTHDYTQLIDRYMVRHLIKPGITGWAQVLGYRGATEELWQMEGRVEKDVWYIENWHLMLDIKIIVRTVINAIRGEKNAY
ncbi:MAG: undecaprenyl-phosphate glucose phosphotransferase [Muribaculaceae bacterium]|nr:undecaprenyl-phosphate glucose phosphotransferase [Muribaculaceae bacterium]